MMFSGYRLSSSLLRVLYPFLLCLHSTTSSQTETEHEHNQSCSGGKGKIIKAENNEQANGMYSGIHNQGGPRDSSRQCAQDSMGSKG